MIALLNKTNVQQFFENLNEKRTQNSKNEMSIKRLKIDELLLSIF